MTKPVLTRKFRQSQAAQKDTDARWTVKYSKAEPAADGAKRADIDGPSFGYKDRIGIGRRRRPIRAWTAADAARHDGAVLPALLDTACRPEKNRAHLARCGLGSEIHRKKPKGKPMPEHIAKANAAKSKVRAGVEHVFAWQKGPMAPVIRTIGLARARVKIGPANLFTEMRRTIWLTENAVKAA